MNDIIKSGNLFDGLPPDQDREVTEVLLRRANIRMERILSFGQSSPETGWYDQEEDEWVVVLSGEAVLEFLSEDGQVWEERMKTGGFRWIRAGEKHRVKSTSAREATIWLAVFIRRT